MTDRISTKPPSGFRDFIGDEARQRYHLQSQFADVFKSFGYSPLETSALENLNVLQGGGGGDENEKLIFKIMKRGAKWEEALSKTPTEDGLADFGLRFDMTVPLARCIAEYRGQIKFPFKVFHMGPVWRAERAQKGRYREFIQCDVDIVGSADLAAEFDVLSTSLSALSSVTTEKFTLHINDRRLLKTLAVSLGWPEAKADEFAVILDKRDKVEGDILEKEFLNHLGSIPPLLKKIMSDQWTLEEAEMLSPESAAAIRQVMNDLSGSVSSQFSLRFDPSLARGLGYYTGLVFELRHASAGYSLGGGGRYDHLIGRFSKEEIPAVGFSLGFERLVLLLGQDSRARQENKILVAVMDETDRKALSELARYLRCSGMEVSLYPAAAKLKKQMAYAADGGFSHILFRGSDERSKGVLKVKSMASGLENEVTEVQLQEKGLVGL